MIYFDNAATTMPYAAAVDAAKQYLFERFYNPSALYAEGYEVQQDLNIIRKNLLKCVADVEKFDLIFTSCGTEADNQAIFYSGRRGNVVTTSGEHSAVFSSVNELKQRGVEVRFAKLNADGSVNVENLLELVDENTSLVSVIHVNNETGAVNDIVKIAAQVKAKSKYARFHSDGVQAFGKIPFKLSDDIDLYSISAHKIGGLKGCGALIKRKNYVIKPHIFGGGQESGLRSGTENVFAIAVFQTAAEIRYSKIKENFDRLSKIKQTLWENLDKSLFYRISADDSSPYILSVSAVGVRGETVLHEADDAGLIIGTGSACSSNEKKRFSRTILACGVDEKVADGVLRLSFSPENTQEEAVQAATILNKIVKNRKNIMA